jgi:sugar phosphate permease
MTQQTLPSQLIPRLPFFYGWVILACVCCAAIARQGSAVATLSIFLEPMIAEFGWSRAALAGAVSLGGVLAAVVSPFLGPMLDRHGARLILCVAVLVTGLSTMALSATQSLLAFYIFFSIARTNFAGTFDLGIYGAVNNWFVARRPLATSIAGLSHAVGLAAFPLIAHYAIAHNGWRAGWVAVGVTVLIVGLLPNWLFMVRRPEDVGLQPDRRYSEPSGVSGGASATAPAMLQPSFTRAQALRTPAFWLLTLFTLAIFPVQAGLGLHQAPHLIERGLSPGVAAMLVSTFSVASAIAGLVYGLVTRKIGVRTGLALVGIFYCVASLVMRDVSTPLQGYISATCMGIALGGLMTVLPIAWGDYFGRESYGAIRGVALSVQVVAQASGPLLSGILRDWTGSYGLSLACFAILAGLATLTAAFARPPAAPAG